MLVSLLTTVSNPFDPFTQYDEWAAYDAYESRLTGQPDCQSYLASIAKTSGDLLPDAYNEAISDAIDEIVKINLSGNYIKVTKEF